MLSQRQTKDQEYDLVYLPPTSVGTDVVGESYRAATIRELSIQGDEFIAVLRLESVNGSITKAIAVYISERHVGYIAKELAGNLRPSIEQLESQGKRIACQAVFYEDESSNQDFDPDAEHIIQIQLNLDPAAVVKSALPAWMQYFVKFQELNKTGCSGCNMRSGCLAFLVIIVLSMVVSCLFESP